MTDELTPSIEDDVLTQSEKDMCQNVVVFGLDYLRSVVDLGPDQIASFVRRKAVRNEIERLKRQYEDRTGIQERTQFFAQLKLNAMVPAAVNILAKSLRGAYKDGNGELVAPPARGQLDAALEVLNRANIQGAKWGGNDQTPTIDARSVSIAIGKGGGSVAGGISSEGRERVRAVLASLVKKVSENPTRGKKSTDAPSDDQ